MNEERLVISEWEVEERSLRRRVRFQGALATGIAHCLEIKFEMSDVLDHEILHGTIRLSPSFFPRDTRSVMVLAVGSDGLNHVVECFGWFFHGNNGTLNLHLVKEEESIQLINFLAKNSFVTFKVYCAKTDEFIDSIPFPNPNGIDNFSDNIWNKREFDD